MELLTELERLEEKILKAIQYFKEYKKERPTSEDILKFVNNSYNNRVDFSLFKEAMRELKLQRRINSEMKSDGKFTYFIPRVPEIILKLNRPDTKQAENKRNSVPVNTKMRGEQMSSAAVERRRQNVATMRTTRFLERVNIGRKVLVVNNVDSYDEDFDDVDEEDEERCNDDVGTLEKFIDKMMDRIDPDDIVVSKEPAPNVLSLYEQRIFDLKSEVLFLRKLTTSNNTLLMDEIKFLRDELHSKNDVIGHLTSQVAVTGAEFQYEVGFSQNAPVGELEASKEIAINKSATTTTTTTRATKEKEDDLLKQTMIKWMGESWLKEVPGMERSDDVFIPPLAAPTHLGMNILEQVKTGITPRHKGMEAHVAESEKSKHALSMAQMFGNLFGLSVDTPLKKLRESGMIITNQSTSEQQKQQQKQLLVQQQQKQLVQSRNDTYAQEGPTQCQTLSRISQTHETSLEEEIIEAEDSNGTATEEVDDYRGWVSLDIMDRLRAPSLKEDPEEMELTLRSLCDTMAEKLRTFCNERNMNYDDRMEEPCLSLSKLSLDSNANSLLTHTYVNRSMAT